jgi:hypothetical protein
MIARSNSAKYAEHLEESPSGRGGCVNRLLFEIEIAANGVQFAKKADEILQRSAKPIDRPRGNDIDLAAHDLFQKPIERWPSVTAFRAADALVGKFGGDNPSRPTTDCFGERSTLVVDGLPIFRRDPKVELGGEETCPSRRQFRRRFRYGVSTVTSALDHSPAQHLGGGRYRPRRRQLISSADSRAASQ